MKNSKADRDSEEIRHTTFRNFAIPVARRRAVFTMTAGPDIGRVIPLEPGCKVILGRSDKCVEVIKDHTVSRVHAIVEWNDASPVLRDAGSANGTFVNAELVTGPTVLPDGAHIQLGSHVELRYSIVSAREERNLRWMHETTIRDPLTGLFTRQQYYVLLERHLALAARMVLPISAIAIDVDHFKRVNDTRGHACGDAVLRRIGEVLRESVRLEDIVGRIGGEELAVACPGIDVEGAAILASRLRRAIAETALTYDGHTVAVTASFGVASTNCVDGAVTSESLMRRADARLYAAKQQGRNRVVATGGTCPTRVTARPPSHRSSNSVAR